ncbi:MAG: hypothetical protein K6T34_07675 [Thermoflavifilum sp.]|nr:hypothetical protein [Thermoflavifilum sp.]
MKIKLHFIWWVISLCTALPASAQQGHAKDSTAAVQFHVGITYLSQFTYGGRRDSASMAYLMPSLTITSKPGFFLSAIPYLHEHGHQPWEGWSLTPGYVWRMSDHFSTVFSYTQYWVDTAHASLLASLQAIGDVNLMFHTKHIEAQLENSYVWERQQDHDWLQHVQITFPISLMHQPQIMWKPSLAVDAGTQTFYKTYYTHAIKQSALLGLPIGQITQKQQKAVKTYQLLSFEVQLPFTCSYAHWQASVTPYFILPMNTPGFTKNESNPFFFFTAQIMYHF